MSKFDACFEALRNVALLSFIRMSAFFAFRNILHWSIIEIDSMRNAVSTKRGLKLYT